MTRGDVLSLAVSGLRGTGRTSLYQQLELVLPKDEFLRGCEFAFLGNPFGHLPHPLQWDGNHKRFGLSRLFECWSMLNDFTNDRWLPALRAGKIPVMDSCGLDAVLYATAGIGCRNEDDEVMSWHRELVQKRLVKQGVNPPFYLMTRADQDTVISFLVKLMPDLARADARTFIDKERHIISEYFKEDGGQHQPHYLESAMSQRDMVTDSVAFIRRRVQMRLAA